MPRRWTSSSLGASKLIEMRTAEGNRRRLAMGRLREQLDEHLAWLDRQLRDVDDELDRLLRSSPV